jgi:hypothetical protein
MQGRSGLILVRDIEFAGSGLEAFISEKYPGIQIVENLSQVDSDNNRFAILLNGFPDKHYPEIKHHINEDTIVIDFLPVGRNYMEAGRGLRHIECIFGTDDRGKISLFVLEGSKVSDPEAVLHELFPEVPVSFVDRNDLELMASDKILRPLIARLMLGNMPGDRDFAYFTEALLRSSIHSNAHNISFIRDAIRHNPFSSSAFNEIEKMLKKTWNDLSFY